MSLNGAMATLLVAAAAWTVLALLFLYFRAKSYGKRKLFAKAAGGANSVRRGAIYAFTSGMLPWAKESVRENLISYALGVAYHLGIFASFALLARFIICAFGRSFVFHLPHAVIALAQTLIVLSLCLGVIGGVSLLVKRAVNPVLRGISCPDDYISNILATAAAALALASHLTPRAWLTQAWLITGIILLVYIPMGKMRHCLFFFITRYNLGAFFGRRGCMPPQSLGGGIGA
jgi:hypothetical protein